MQPLTVKQYLERNYVNKNFDFLELLKALQPDPNDRVLIEKEIEDTVHDILTDATNETALQHLASTIAVSDFRILRSDPVINYWNVLKLQRTSCQNAMEQNINALNEVQKSYKSYNTRSQRTENENDEFYEIDGMMLTGMKRSAGSIIKTEAIKRAKAAKELEARVFIKCQTRMARENVFVSSMYSLVAVNKVKDTITVNVEEAEEKSHLIIAILEEKRTKVD
ncbi:hypothetical protein G6F22_011122 [Rhizopus arrhizus]|nr:hypothetical protein G6F24_013438 [Rhizopus arrhizus]KAG0778633.1 hypothetical protein G6F22_011122 [Rhizopus arrhizus]KAG0778745.1 hypothetical protein G6F21_012860 [Rhizopus arrhizus]